MGFVFYNNIIFISFTLTIKSSIFKIFWEEKYSVKYKVNIFDFQIQIFIYIYTQIKIKYIYIYLYAN